MHRLMRTAIKDTQIINRNSGTCAYNFRRTPVRTSTTLPQINPLRWSARQIGVLELPARRSMSKTNPKPKSKRHVRITLSLDPDVIRMGKERVVQFNTPEFRYDLSKHVARLLREDYESGKTRVVIVAEQSPDYRKLRQSTAESHLGDESPTPPEAL
jgi:hypothetical protein